MRVVAVTALLIGLAGAPAWADGPMATSSAAQITAPQPSTPAAALPPGGPEGVDDEAAMGMGPCGPEKVKPNGQLAHAPHGEVEAGVGTNGYRHIAGVVCQPIGDNGAVQVGVSETQGDGWRGRR
ncbi:MAG TPA: hypothetical protein VHW60_20890 [Caulobacteraceae bacterium]|jgi:hypothetical protein|nr:hypothetical protein [Caulobacteraceae bacterium]